jgi:hypothetical protein
VDPREHVRTLKSPLRDRLVNFFTKDRSRSPDITHRSSALVVEKSEPGVTPLKSKVQKAPSLRVVANIPVLGGSLKAQGHRVLAVDKETRKVSPPPLKYLGINGPNMEEPRGQPAKFALLKLQRRLGRLY